MKSFFKKIIIAIITTEARIVLARRKPKIITVTGSVGKTSTKDAIYTAISGAFYVRKSEKSFNSEIGIPLTILGCNNAWTSVFGWLENILKGVAEIFSRKKYPEWLILEVGADRPNDIKTISKWLYSDVIVYTRIGDTPVHVEFFKSAEHLFEEKSALINGLNRGGILVLNADDDKVISLKNRTKQDSISYGQEAYADIRAVDFSITYENNLPDGIRFKVETKNESEFISVKGVFGKHLVYSILAGVAVALSQKISLRNIAESFKGHETPPGRMRAIFGIKNSLIIDDTYNASPVAMEEAIDTLSLIKTTGKKIAILGDMLELGKYSVSAHKKIGEKISKCADFIITVGQRAKTIAETAMNFGFDEEKIIQYDSSLEVSKDIDSLVSSGDVILVKGSQGMRMERIVEEIMANPEKKKELLVRQDREWEER